MQTVAVGGVVDVIEAKQLFIRLGIEHLELLVFVFLLAARVERESLANEQDFLGWYVEGMMMMGGLGLIGDVMHSAVTQVDNGAYGKIRIASNCFSKFITRTRARRYWASV